MEFCRRQRRASGFPGGCWQASAGSGGQQGPAGLDWELCANWPGSRERGSETQSVGDCHTWVKCAEACELEVRWGQEHGMLPVPACHTGSADPVPSPPLVEPSFIKCLHSASCPSIPGKVTRSPCCQFLWSPQLSTHWLANRTQSLLSASDKCLYPPKPPDPLVSGFPATTLAVPLL